MRRRLILSAAAWTAFGWMGIARAQPKSPSANAARVGILVEGTSADFETTKKSFVEGMRELGWMEGRNLIYDFAYADRDLTRLPALAAALVARRPDVIFVRNTQPALAVAASTRTIPIVFNGVTDPEKRGLVKSLRAPGGNVTGINTMGVLGGKRMQLLKQALPKIGRVGVLVNPSYSPTSSEDYRLIEQAAKNLGVSVISAQVTDAKELKAAFELFAQRRVEAVVATQNPLFGRERKRLLELATRQRIPFVGGLGLADDGALMGYGTSTPDEMRRAAQLADKILKGTKPADIPVEQPTKFELVLNLKIARALGLAIPQSFMLLADRVIE